LTLECIGITPRTQRGGFRLRDGGGCNGTASSGRQSIGFISRIVEVRHGRRWPAWTPSGVAVKI